MKQGPGMQKKDRRLDVISLLLMMLLTFTLLYAYPDKREPVISVAASYLLEMLLILPAVMIIMGLFSVFVSDEAVVRHLGQGSGIKGFFAALFFGSLPTGPLYIAFPVASAMLGKGARTSNIVVFLSAWACIKIPQELVELQFLGPEFMITRLLLTIVFVSLMGIVIEWLTDNGQSCHSQL
ncbi:MAG: permease [Methanolobus sp.]|nr:permease [Methanolobus sp.]